MLGLYGRVITSSAGPQNSPKLCFHQHFLEQGSCVHHNLQKVHSGQRICQFQKFTLGLWTIHGGFQVIGSFDDIQKNSSLL